MIHIPVLSPNATKWQVLDRPTSLATPEHHPQSIVSNCRMRAIKDNNLRMIYGSCCMIRVRLEDRGE